MAENHTATAEDFRRAAEVRRAEEQLPERVVLPNSGYAVVLRRPTPMWFLFHGHLPMSLAARQSDTAGTIQSAEELVEFSKWMVELLGEVFVAPKLSLNPGANEISPEWLGEEDVNFIIRWAVGEVTADATSASGSRDLARFRGKASRAHSPARPGSGNVSLPPEPVTPGDNDGSAD